MPNYVRYSLKADKRSVTCQEVDDLMCKHFGVPTDPTKWHHNWYNHIALLQSVGRTYEELREDYKDYKPFGPILDWMEATLDVDSYYSPG